MTGSTQAKIAQLETLYLKLEARIAELDSEMDAARLERREIMQKIKELRRGDR